MIVELDDYENEFIKIQDLIMTMQFCMEHCRCVSNDAYYLETLMTHVASEYAKLLEKLIFNWQKLLFSVFILHTYQFFNIT